jgi:crotonobetainyl-CoA:carnitine CoA-transferase CaiB-like acyl-CoA transferase
LSTKPLQGLKVLDLTQFVSGPFCTQILADLGADVVKIEKPGVGDPYRRAGPSFVDHESTLFLSLNRVKRSLALNLKSELGREIFLKRLVPDFDILVENFTPGTMEALGLGYDSCKQENPGIIYSAISGFGDRGPSREKGGFDLILQAVTGIMDLTGEADGGPVKVGIPITDFAAGLFSAIGILSALYQRKTGSEGSKISTSLYESSVSLLSILACDYLASGNVPRRLGSASPTFAPYQAFLAKDAYIAVGGAGSEEMWHRFVEALGAPELSSDSRFAMNADRVKNQRELAEIIDARLSEKDAKYWLRLFEAHGVPCGPVGTLPEVLESQQSKALALVGETSLRNTDPNTTYKSVRLPLSFRDEPVAPRKAPPGLGEHTEEVLRSLGVTADMIAELLRNQVIE